MIPRMPRRRALLIAMALLFAMALAVFYWWSHPLLTATERQLVGQWTTPNPNPRAGYVTNKGPVSNPALVMELRRDRSFRVWVISPDDPGVSIPQKEGQWSAQPGELTFHGFGPTGDSLRELREKIRIRLGGSYVGRTSGTVSHTIRLDGPDSLRMTPPNGNAVVWQRRK